MRRAALGIALAAGVVPVVALAGPERCGAVSTTKAERAACARGAKPKPEPVWPDRARRSGEGGFYDLGGGAELRVGGRVRMEYETRR